VSSIDKVGAGWRARWRSPEGASRSKTFRLKVEAENHLTSVHHSKLTCAYVDPRAGQITFEAFAEQWRASQVHRPHTAAQIETLLRRRVYPRLGHRRIGAIRPSEIQGLVKWLASGAVGRAPLAASSVQTIFSWVRTIFRAAIADKVIAESPCQKVSLPAVDDKRVTPLPVETVENLIDAVPTRYRALIVLGAGTGPRISEALGLTNDRIDWIRREVTIDRQLVGHDKGVPSFGPVKDKKNRPRTIPLPQTVVDELAAHVARYGLGPPIFSSPGHEAPRSFGRPSRRCGSRPLGRWASHSGTATTSCATSMRPPSSPTGVPSRSCRGGSGTPRPR